jgi:DNA end-binding protein Ku
MVVIPVKLYTAAETKDISFRQIHAGCAARVNFRRFCSGCNEEIPYADLAKGIETPAGGMLVITDADLDSLPLPTTKRCEVHMFIPAGQIDPSTYAKPYYVGPDGPASVKAYALLREAMAATGKVALVRITMRTRESMAIIRPHDDGMMVLQLMAWPEEIRQPDFEFDAGQISEQERKMAIALVEALADDFDPAAYHSEYDAAMRAMVTAKLSGEDVPVPADVPTAAPVGDIMAALAASIAAVGKPPAAAGAAAPAAKTKAKAKREKTPAAA